MKWERDTNQMLVCLGKKTQLLVARDFRRIDQSHTTGEPHAWEFAFKLKSLWLPQELLAQKKEAQPVLHSVSTAPHAYEPGGEVGLG